MTRKDFQVVADIIAIYGVYSTYFGVEGAKSKIDDILRAQNPHYNAQKFWEAVEAAQDTHDDYIKRCAD